jgi:hypothetical protein
MKTIILGQKIENIYDVNHNWKTINDENGNLKTVYTAKPTLNKTSIIKEWVEICSHHGEPRYNSTSSLFGSLLTQPQLNISENETIQIKEQIFRADLNEMHLRTNKIVEEIDVDEQEARATLSEQIRAFNAMMITSNDKLQSYCDVHKLSYEDTDAIELFSIVFPNQCYEIKDGIIAPKNVNMYVSSACLTAEQANWCTIATNNYNSVNCAIDNIVKAEE